MGEIRIVGPGKTRGYPSFKTMILLSLCHGGESRDILNVYSDRTCKKIDNCFFNTQ